MSHLHYRDLGELVHNLFCVIEHTCWEDEEPILGPFCAKHIMRETSKLLADLVCLRAYLSDCAPMNKPEFIHINKLLSKMTSIVDCAQEKMRAVPLSDMHTICAILKEERDKLHRACHELRDYIKSNTPHHVALQHYSF